METAIPPQPTGALNRLVLDTNAVLDVWAFRDARAAALREALESDLLDWPACPGMRAELESVLRRGVAAQAQADEVLALWDAHVRAVPPPASSGLTDHRAIRCRDPDDQVFLDLALRERAGWLLTADRDLLTLRRAAARRGLRIATIQEWPGVSACAAQAHGPSACAPAPTGPAPGVRPSNPADSDGTDGSADTRACRRGP